MKPIRSTIAGLKYRIPDDLHAKYLLGKKNLIISRINILFVFSITLIPVAIVFDLLIFPEKWTSLALVRGVSALLCLTLYSFSNHEFFRKNPKYIPCLLTVIASTTIAYLTHLTGGMESSYYAGQILIYICLAMIVPFSLFESILTGGSIIAIHYGLNLFPALVSGATIGWPHVWNSVYFLSFSFGMVLFASVILENYRRKIFVSTENEIIRNAKLLESNRKIDELLKTKNLFLTNITHELKTPLSIVIGNADLIMEKAGELDPSIKDNLKIIQQAAFQLTTHVDRLIAVTNADDPDLKLTTDNYDYVGVVKNVYALFRNRALADGIDLQLKCVDKPLVANIDIYRIEEVLNNLIQNAFKFTPKYGSITVSVGSDGQSAITEVHDTGKGIAEDQLPLIFERLYQADDVLSKQHNGMGIGLYLCKRNVEIHGGRIEVRSRVGKGSTFQFTLPLYFDQATTVKNMPYTGPERRKRDRKTVRMERRMEERKKKYEFQFTLGLDDLAAITHVENIQQFENRNPLFPSVLIVEDNPGMIKVMIDGLGDEYNLFLAFNGTEGLRKLNSHPNEISLILTDIMMPEMSGYDFCQRIRQTEEWRHIPLVFVTALLKEDEQLRGYELGATDYIVKPYNIRILKEKVAHWISRRQYELLLRGMSASLEARLNAASKMKSIILHEIRNPLQVITGAGSCLEIIRNTIPQKMVGEAHRLDKYLNLLQKGIESLSAVIDATHKIGDGFISNRKPEPVKTLFDDSMTQMTHLLGSNRIDLDLDAVGEACIFCDRRMLTQVFVNIIRNATEAIVERNPSEGGQIRIQASHVNPKQIKISFRDNGAGMTPQVKQNLFKFKFTTKRDGNGVGLHLSKMIIKLHDGQIHVDSIQGVGTEFHVLLPVSADSDGANPPLPFPSAAVSDLSMP